MHYATAVETFVTRLQTEFGDDCFDWIDAPDQTDGLEDVDPENINPTAFEVEVGLSTEGLSLKEVDELHEAITTFADEEEVGVEVTAADANVSVYTFYLHSLFIGRAAGELQTAEAYEQAYVMHWREILSSHDRFKYYPTETREAVLKKAAVEQRERDSVSF